MYYLLLVETSGGLVPMLNDSPEGGLLVMSLSRTEAADAIAAALLSGWPHARPAMRAACWLRPPKVRVRPSLRA